MKRNKIIFWIASVVILIWEGIMPLGTLLFAPEYATFGTRPLGYPDYFAYSLIFCKVLGATAICLLRLPEKLREWAYAGLTFNLIFAFISHACVDRNPAFMAMPLVVLGILMLSYIFKNRWQHG